MSNTRLDLLLVARGMVESRSLAQRLVMAGQVRVDGQVVLKPSTKVPGSARLEIDQGPPYVSRGGEKLAAALQAFKLDVAGRVCADVGASTGGFTDCLLQNGAARVYAIDVGKGILHWKLRQDRRVVVMEEINARYLERLPEPVQIVTIDASFISLNILLLVVKGWFSYQGEEKPPDGPQTNKLDTRESYVVALIKPQFEAGRAQVSRGSGVIRDPQIHKEVLLKVLEFGRVQGYTPRGLIRSPLLGPKGNVEFLIWLDCSSKSEGAGLAFDIDEILGGDVAN
jgi:23S rRNA (cytidine1920-2'-O)/16S rRNA (cytidine1409-2'-O)-methyltransferase